MIKDTNTIGLLLLSQDGVINYWIDWFIVFFLISHMILIADSVHTTSQALHSKHKLGSVIFTIPFSFSKLPFDFTKISAGQLRMHFKHRTQRL